MRDFRFSFNILDVGSRDALIDRCRRSAELGYDVVLAADHLGAPAPFPLLVAIADATPQRVGTLVLNAPFWNAALLAREIATTDVLTDGRLEIGLGAGHMKWEFDAADIEWKPFGGRVEQLAATVDDLHTFFTTDFDELPEERDAPRPLQRSGFEGSGPPLLIGGTGDRVLRIAAAHADTVGVAGTFQIPGKPPGTFRLATAEETDERIRFVRKHAGSRADGIEWHLLVQMVVETDDRESAARRIAERMTGSMTADAVLDTPYLLLGTVDEMAEQLARHRKRYGFSYITVHDPYMEVFAPVIDALRKRG
ncbi:LLM class F420-dependent oxidoreductase [Rhodococcus oxybenzonivorans]|uniref:LLM class F420-dependent oxidoreductase n=1 Tax=Rhodococcus oxybenzonivorans TaxID=1990687 RepID=UPI002954C66A|nr:LLM class F420-dependent oxidoreductase [Rhodococcus oxybenzonivorans]MDV7351494.1 LLM class F420-dependent oxidoreductase [Rhodococcus oxybenzonivorans]